MRSYIKILLIGCLISILGISITGASVLKSYSFSNQSDVAEWNTSWKWGGTEKMGSATWSSKYDGTAKLTISGAPGAIDFWNRLPCDLEFGDYFIVTFHCDAPLLDNASHFDMIIGPTDQHNWKQEIPVSNPASGSFSVRMPIYIPVFNSGTPFGIHFVTWPGSSNIYIEEILLER